MEKYFAHAHLVAPKGARGTAQAAHQRAFSFSFPSLLSLTLLQHERSLTHDDREADPSLLAYSHIMNGYRD